jgi:hypothetical protein
MESTNFLIVHSGLSLFFFETPREHSPSGVGSDILRNDGTVSSLQHKCGWKLKLVPNHDKINAHHHVCHGKQQLNSFYEQTYIPMLSY